MAESWERPREPNGRFMKKTVEVAPYTVTPEPRITLRELDAGKVFTENMEKSGAVRKYYNVAEAVSAMETDLYEAHQEMERLRATIDIKQQVLDDVRRNNHELRQQIADATEVNARLQRKVDEQARTIESNLTAQRIQASSIRQRSARIEELEKERAQLATQEGLPSRLRRATEQLQDTKLVLERQVRDIQKVLNPEV